MSQSSKPEQDHSTTSATTQVVPPQSSTSPSTSTSQPKFPSTLVPPSYVEGLSARIRQNLVPPLTPLLSRSNVHNVLEFSSGNGTHLSIYSKEFPGREWQPTECDEYGRSLIDETLRHGHIGEGNDEKVRKAKRLDVMDSKDWDALDSEGKEEWDLVLGHNFIHMIPLPDGPEMIFKQLKTRMRGAGSRQLVIYGPMKKDDGYFSENDQKFDEMIKARPNAGYIGLRSIDELGRIAERNGWELKERIGVAMGNWVLVFQLR